MDDNSNKEIDLVSVDWNNLSKENFNSIYSQLSERNTGSKIKKTRTKAKVEQSKRTKVKIDGVYYNTLIHQLKKYNDLIDDDEKAEYKKTLISCSEIVEIEEF